MQPYDYAHRDGIEEITWELFGELAASLAEKLASEGVEIIVGVARAGLFPATAVSCALRRDLYPIRLSRRVNDEVKFKHPVWKVDVSPEVAGRVVAIVDEMTDTGQTLALVKERVYAKGAKHVITASLFAHSWANPMPIAARVTDALVIFPWDKRVLIEGQWKMHPEIAEALKLQNPDETPPKSS